MARIAIVTDSAAGLPPSLVRDFGIRVVPFELIWDGVVYRDGIDLAAAEFYRRFRTEHTYPTTSQPSLGAFLNTYSEAARESSGIVSIHVASELTGTVRTAQAAAELMPNVPVRVVDSRMATIAEGFAVLAAARAAARNAGLDAVAAAAEAASRSTGLAASLKTLEHIHRGGRLGDAASLLGSQLKIVPVLALGAGNVRVAGITRSWQSAMQQIVDYAAEQAGGRCLAASAFHGDLPEDAAWLRERFLERVECPDFMITEFTPVMGAHTGPDVVGLAYHASA